MAAQRPIPIGSLSRSLHALDLQQPLAGCGVLLLQRLFRGGTEIQAHAEWVLVRRGRGLFRHRLSERSFCLTITGDECNTNSYQTATPTADSPPRIRRLWVAPITGLPHVCAFATARLTSPAFTSRSLTCTFAPSMENYTFGLSLPITKSHGPELGRATTRISRAEVDEADR